MLVLVLLLSGIDSSAQRWGRGGYHGYGYGRYYSSYYSYGVYPRLSVVAGFPFGAIGLSFGSPRYHRYYYPYYRPASVGIAIVAPPPYYSYRAVSRPAKKAPAAQQSPEYERVIIAGKTYYRKGDIYYKASVGADGDIQYEQVGEAGK